jgi:hypothetical protein
MYDDMQPRDYCHAFILPVWEHWTNGTPPARRLLECTSTDIDIHVSLFRRLLVEMCELYRRDAGPPAVAALAAASTCCTAYMDAPTAQFDVVCVRAIDADALARRTPVT